MADLISSLNLSLFFGGGQVKAAKAKVLAFAVLIGLFAGPVSASDCRSQMGNCTYYACMNQQMQCQPDQYFSRFALRYCEIFDQRQNLFTDNGRATLSRIKFCLQNKVENEPQLTCDNALSKAYGHHRDCYLASGFCQLPTRDKFAILEVVYPELRHPGFQTALVQTLAGCVNRGELSDQQEVQGLNDMILNRVSTGATLTH